jgi:UDP-GlcNAc:undecaprenyl-phosphate GlcNAc-1-phosphate transferase
MKIYFILILFVFVNLILVFYFDKIKTIIKLVDYPNGRKLHKNPVPLLGGPILFINLSIFFLLLNLKLINFNLPINFNLFYLFCILIFIIGVLDDTLSISPNNKLLIFAIIFILYCNFEKFIMIESISTSFRSTDINLGKLTQVFTILCFIVFINAFNMFDGINLQSSTYSIFLSINLYFVDKNILFLILIIFLIFFSYLNLKEKSFLGNSGSYLLPFIFSVMFISYHNNINYNADLIFVLMAIPGLELIRLTFQRILSGKHPFLPDRNHIHHIMIKKFSFYSSIILLNFLIYSQLIIYLVFEKTLMSIFFGVLVYSIAIFLLIKNKKK